ncbi:MAG: HEAT repeat domain-containing protein [Syntrophobacterales bacterium]|nr:MAG: HEAT repeat domain-containing protein [Syntrophobacterales bacterium]
MEKGNVKSAFQKLRAKSVDDIIEGLNEIEWKIKALRGKDLNEAILALCSLFYIDLFDRPDLEPAVDRASKILVALGEKAIPLILYEMKEADLKAQLILSRTLGQIGKPAIKPLLKFYSGSFDPSVRCFALYAMGKIREPEMAKIIPKVMDAMDDSNGEVRDTATRVLGKMVEHLESRNIPEKVRKRMFKSLIKNLSDRHSGVRAKAVRSIGKMTKFGFIGPKEKSTAKKAMARILGLDEAFDWDRAYVVRLEAEETMKYLN